MQQLCYADSLLFEDLRPKNEIILLNGIDINIFSKFYERWMLAFAKVLMHSQSFAELTSKDKVRL